jgi:hypothetical protein
MKPDESERPLNWLVLVAVIGGVALFVWLFLAFLDWNKLQTCLSEGRHDCAPQAQGR